MINNGSQSQPKVVRLELNINTETDSQFRDLMEHKTISASETLRRAIAFYAFINSESLAGRNLQVVDVNENTTEDVFLLI